MAPRHGRRDLDATPDHTLVLYAAADDEDSFAELVRRHQYALRGMLFRLTGCRSLADDLAQAAFIQAWRSVGALRDPRQFSSWLRRIASRLWIDHLRSRRNEQPLDDVEMAAPDQAGGVELADVRLDVQAALARLDDWARTCTVLFHAEGLNHAEIAQNTGLPLGTVKSHITRSTQRLRQWLSDWSDQQ